MLYVTGDTHGDFSRFSKFQKLFRRKKDYCLVCGDFGFVWDQSAAEQKLLDRFAKLACNVLFVEGTHDNLDALAQYPLEDFCGGKARRIRGNVFWLQRGHVFLIEDKKVFALGGGESQDSDERQPSVNWWQNEMPTIDELKFARQMLAEHQDTVDLIVTHSHPHLELGLIEQNRQKVNALTAFLVEVQHNVAFSHWYFGSEHLDKKISGKMTAVFEQVIKVVL